MPGREITIRAAGGAAFMAYLAEPESGDGPGLVVIQDIFAVSDYLRGVADDFAAAGYRACAPDLFWRLEPGLALDHRREEDVARARAMGQAFDRDAGTADCMATLDYLRQKSPKAGAVGYCMGGRLAYHMATRSGADCSVGYYGVGIEDALDEAADLRGPLLLHIGETDVVCPPEAQAKIYEALEGNSLVTLHTYEGAGHAFARPGATYHEQAAARADARTLEYLKKHLAG